MANDQSISPCPIDRTLDVVGERWGFLILRDVFYGVRRFDALHKRLGISRKILSARLSALVAAGMLKRAAYQERPARYEYRPTEMARDFFPVLLAMSAWANRWQLETGAASVQIKHVECGQFVQAISVCSCCGKPLRPGNVEAKLRLRSSGGSGGNGSE